MKEVFRSEFDVFVCDDEVDLLTILIDELSILKLKAKCFETAQPLLDQLKHELPLLILTDLHMPKLSGIEMARIIREQGIKIPVIMISGDIAQKNIDGIKAIPGCHYLAKPFFTDELHHAIHEALKDTSYPQLAK